MTAREFADNVAVADSTLSRPPAQAAHSAEEGSVPHVAARRQGQPAWWARREVAHPANLRSRACASSTSRGTPAPDLSSSTSDGALAAALESVTAVPSLKATSIDFVLRSASQYDDHSKDAIAELLASHFVKECCDALQSPANFSGAVHLPALLDACRASFVMRPAAAARVLSALYTACSDAPEVNWTAAIAAVDRLLCIGLFKREIVGPTLPRPLADSVRRLRKLLQKRESNAAGKAKLAVRFDEPSQQWALRSYRLRELDRYTG